MTARMNKVDEANDEEAHCEYSGSQELFLSVDVAGRENGGLTAYIYKSNEMIAPIVFF
jgi:hypothetical protein